MQAQSWRSGIVLLKHHVSTNTGAVPSSFSPQLPTYQKNISLNILPRYLPQGQNNDKSVSYVGPGKHIPVHNIFPVRRFSLAHESWEDLLYQNKIVSLF